MSFNYQIISPSLLSFCLSHLSHFFPDLQETVKMMRMMRGRAKVAPYRYYMISLHITLGKESSLILFFNVTIPEKDFT